MRAGVTAKRSAAADGHWIVWNKFCTELAVDPLLTNIEDPVLLLQVFALRYRNGTIAPKGNAVRSRTVEDALRSIGQTFAAMGADDPRLNKIGNIEFRLQRQLAGYKKKDPPPNRVKPIPVQVIQYILNLARSMPDDAGTNAVADMIAIAFFFLLRPGEYTGTKSETTPFRLQDVQLQITQHHRLDPLTAPLDLIKRATFASLEFTDQKNGVKGEVIGLGRSGDPKFCPVLSIINRVLHLREHNAPPTTPLASYYRKKKLVRVKPADITASLKSAVAFHGPALGFLPENVSARSLRASGAMALLCAQVDFDIIRLVGRWHSDQMLRYLHVQAEPVMRGFAKRMLQGGNFVLHPNSEVPCW